MNHHAAAAVDGADGPVLSVEETYIDHETLSAGRGPLTAVFLHGLLGCGKNWRSFSKGLAVQAAKREGRDVRSLLVDLRGHGGSAVLGGLHPPHTIAAAGADVVRTLAARLGGAPHVLVGLSLGGKVALDVLQRLHAEQAAHLQRLQAELAAARRRADAGGAEGSGSGGGGGGAPHHHHEDLDAAPLAAPHRALPLQCWVLDSQPGAVAAEADAQSSVARILSRSRAALEAEGLPKAVGWWLGSGLVPVSRREPAGPLRWEFDVPGAAALYHSYRSSCYWPTLERPPPGVTLHVVRGEHSDRRGAGGGGARLGGCRLDAAHAAWQVAEVHESERVGRLKLHVLPNAGHWLQADNPLGLQAMMLPFFRDEKACYLVP
ncbi:MAG: Alpha/Beta hydrolase protein [Monoraphidium minutum]|nr:MAG: Alpha/Beta hydrolase protein [Monoraphidium minutum]